MVPKTRRAIWLGTLSTGAGWGRELGLRLVKTLLILPDAKAVYDVNFRPYTTLWLPWTPFSGSSSQYACKFLSVGHPP